MNMAHHSEERHARALRAVDRNRALLERAKAHPYRRVEHGEAEDLLIHAYLPPERTSDQAPAILFFHGSLWDKGLVSQFAPQALYFAERGVASFLVEYRMASSHFTGPLEALDDARCALRWVAQRCVPFGIDRSRICLCGASGGAWAAMMAALLAMDPEDSAEGDPLVNALVMFEPVCDTTAKLPTIASFPDKRTARKLKPVRRLQKGLPAALFLHGTADAMVPAPPTAKLAKAWKKHGPADYIAYEGSKHGFYHFGADIRLYENTLQVVEDFLVSRDFFAAGDNQVLSL